MAADKMEARRSACLWLTAALLSGVLPARADNPPPDPLPKPPPAGTVSKVEAGDGHRRETPANTQELNGVVVKGLRDLEAESDRRLKALQSSLPNLDSDGLRKENLGQRAADSTRKYLADHRDPEKLSGDSKAFIERTQNSIDREHHGAVATPATQDSKDYTDPLCQAGSCPP